VDTNNGEEQEEGYPDESRLDEVEFGLSDYVSPVLTPEFTSTWDELGEQLQGLAAFKKPGSASQASPLTQATNEMISFLGMIPVDGSNKIPPGATKHVLFLSGRFMDVPLGDDQETKPKGVLVLARIRMRFVAGQGVVLELVVRTPNLDLSTAMANAIYS